MGKTDPQVQATREANAANIQMNDATNKTNYEIAQMSNEWNERMLDKQIAYNREAFDAEVANQWKMFEAENEYNSASAQRQRLEEAGLNPYVMMDGGNAGTASGSASPQMAGISPPTAVTPTMNPGHVDPAVPMTSRLQKILAVTDTAQGIVDTIAETKSKMAGTEQIHIENKYRASKLASEIAANLANAKTGEERAFQLKLLNSVFEENNALDQDMKRQDIAMRRAQVQGQAIRNLLDWKDLQNYDQRFQLEIQGMVADIAWKKSQKRLTDEQVKTEVEKQIDTMYSHMLKGQDYQMRNENWNVEKQKLRAEVLKAINNAGPEGMQGIWNMGWNWYQPNVNGRGFDISDYYE